MKKLKKYWPRKKKRKRTPPYDPFFYYHPPPSQCRSCCSSSVSSAPQPSAPPLPPWLYQDHEQGPISENAAVPFVEAAFPVQNQFPTLSTVAETNGICDVTLPNGAATATTAALLSYQKYMVAEPVYGVPVANTPQREGRVVSSDVFAGFDLDLFHCFCPCFYIKEVNLVDGLHWCIGHFR